MTGPPLLPVRCPPPPSAGGIDPLVHEHPAGAELVRVHSVKRGGDRFSTLGGTPDAPSGRFSTFAPAVVPLLYAAEDLEGAVSETVFHDVPFRGIKQVPRLRLGDRVATTLRTTRELRLVDLTSSGLRRIGVARTELIESGPRAYPRTSLWSGALHDCPSAPDGLLWVSRQRDTSVCVVLFGDRVRPEDVEVVPGLVPAPLFAGDGYERVARMADDAGITLTEPWSEPAVRG